MLDAATKTWVEISKSALLSNIFEIKHTLKPGVCFMAVVKSNAYGHGLEETVSAIHDQVDWFGVDSLLEAEKIQKTLRSKKNKILILGHTPFAAHERVVRAGLRQVVYGRPAVESLRRFACKKKPALIHLKIETGTSRQGLDIADLPAFARWIKKQNFVCLEGIYTHFANIEDTSDQSYAIKQLNCFNQAVKITNSFGPQLLRHTACSAAVMLHPETQFDLVRVGISLYGLWSSDVTKENVRLRGGLVKLTPAMSWKTRLVQVKKIKSGTPVSYGLTEKVSRDSVIGILPVGYWDGFDRGLSSIGTVLIHGRRVKIIGRICMNMCVVDVTDVNGVHQGDEVVLLGYQSKEKITTEEIAQKIGTINYEVVTRINPLIPRVLID